MIFVLEDSPERMKWFKRHWPNLLHSDNVLQAIEILRCHSNLGLICLDHDLGGAPYKRGEHGDGIDLANMMVEEKLHIKTKIIIHSLNPDGARAMANALHETHIDVVCMPYLNLRDIVESSINRPF